MLRLILPVLFPSWRFFSSIGPSPRIEVGFASTAQLEPADWFPVFPLPEKISFTSGIVQLLHNPKWNDRLYINTCAEHLFESHSEFHEQQIAQRLLHLISAREIPVPINAQTLFFRVRALVAENGQLTEDITFISRAFSLPTSGDDK
ncbi:MAG: hypothetical protein AAGC78_18105 [Cellvibrio sp.]|uniref:hypothetical protein n=1 Tax=Cellvibrio sp. TaxID=1965322 RepID=UPI0031A6CAD0